MLRECISLKLGNSSSEPCGLSCLVIVRSGELSPVHLTHLKGLQKFHFTKDGDVNTTEKPTNPSKSSKTNHHLIFNNKKGLFNLIILKIDLIDSKFFLTKKNRIKLIF